MLKKTLLFLTVFFAIIGVVLSVISLYYLFNTLSECKHEKMKTTTIQPSCKENGYTLSKCSRCAFELKSDFTEPTGHIFSSITVAPTCSAEGYTLNYCACGYSYSSSPTSPTEHSLRTSVIDPTCTEQGYSLYACESCDYVFKSDFTPPTGHSFEEERKFPTSSCEGYTKYSCSCSYSYIANLIFYSDILGNAYVENTVPLAKGIDVSRWNHQIDTLSGNYLPLNWERIKAEGFSFVILKAGSTKSGLEPTFEMDYAGAKAAGLEVGAYFYTYSSTVDGALKDAQLLLSFLEGKQFEYPIYFDLEDPSLSSLGKNYLSNICLTFSEELQKNGYYAGLYTNHNWLTSILDTTKITSLFEIWYARYPGTEIPVWNEEKYGKQLGMWQYTQSGEIDGIEGIFDFNYSYKNYSDIMKKWELNGYRSN